MTTRTDIHRPSSPDFDPQAYSFMGIYAHEMAGSLMAFKQVINKLIDQGYKFGAHGSSQCGHCGARIKFFALMVHHGVKEFIAVGEDCLDNRFDALSKAEFQELREQGRLNRERATLQERIQKLLADYPELGNMVRYEDDSFISDINNRFLQTGILSDRQIEAVIKAMPKADERKAKQAVWAAEKIALEAAGVIAPEGRVEITGTIVSRKWHESDFGGSYKITIKSDEGWTVWMTEPSNVYPEVTDRIRVTATLTRSDSDKLFAFGKRPAKAVIL